MEKTLAYLNSKWWYRLLKVLYILVITFFVIVCIFFNYIESRNYTAIGNGYVFDYIHFIEYFIIENLIILIIFEVIRRAFYYITLGSLNPKK
jgi:hypothetical protein